MRACVSTFPLLALFAPAIHAQSVEFNRDVRPILSDRCYACHGPDSASRKSKVRFDVEASARPALNEMLRRVASTDKAVRMPPVFAGPGLSGREIDVLKRWVAGGARWEKHWSLIAPKRPDAPAVRRREWVRNPIDAFVLARLERDGLTPSPEADKATLLRRASLDITGVPPTLAELDAFLRDGSPGAYEKQIDRLLASPRYGERMAYRWLDAARYADTNGYQTDAERYMWRWRDWVIDAFNGNMPFDRFTVEQLAGDLLPNATLDQIIATGFNRNHRGNGEGGIIPEEYAVEYVVDRVETTSTVWLGLTLGCARCHDHKYDPFSQKEFYQLYAYFNSIPEKGKVFKYGNSPPMVAAPTVEQQAKLREIDERLTAAQARFAAVEPEAIESQREWERSLATKPVDWTIEQSLVLRKPLDGEAGEFDGKHPVQAGEVARFGFYDKFSVTARIYAASMTGAIVTKAEQQIVDGEGWGLYLSDGRLQVNLVKRWLDDALRVETESKLDPNRWYHVAMSYDGSRIAGGIKIYVDGVPRKLRYLLDDLNQSFETREPVRIGAGFDKDNGFRGRIRDARIYSGVLTPNECAMLADSATLAEIAALDRGKRTPSQQAKLDRAFVEQFAAPHAREAWKELKNLEKLRSKTVESFPTVMVMQDLPEPRQAHILLRGSYDRPGAPVSRAAPAMLPPLPAGAPNNRLGLAKWIVGAENPLTARVTVNRFWQMLFGTGIVRTVEDFGSQGEWPSHPELLDWLATEYVRTGWDTKALLKTIVTSATYRQSSKITAELAERDPENRLLARGPRFRLPAEMVRDQALFASGLLVEKRGGPSVKPYQPAGLWKELSGGADYVPDKGEGLWRRSLYTFWKRASPPPGMAAFDAAGRETCIVREVRTNTPLQALTLMNAVTYLEAARKLAERAMKEGGATVDERVSYAFRLLTARAPAAAELDLFRGSYGRYLDRFRTSPDAAARYLKQGASPRGEKLDTGEMAAYAAVCSLMLNLDEVVNKQ